MIDDTNVDLRKDLWEQPSDGFDGTLLDEMRAKSIVLAHQCGMSDPEGDAAEALVHLYSKTPELASRFLRGDDTWDLVSLRKYSHTTLKNQLRSIQRKPATKREILGVDEEALEVFADRVEDLEESGVTFPKDIDALLIQRDKLLILFQLIRNQEQSYQDQVLAKAAGFKRTQIAACTRISTGYQTVLRHRRAKRLKLSSRPLKSSPHPTFDHPENDLPLCTAGTPHLQAAFKAWKREPGTRLLRTLLGLVQPHRVHYYSRLAGFWDCVIAEGLDTRLLEHRESLCVSRAQIERVLAESEVKPSTRGGAGTSTGKGESTMSRELERPMGEMCFASTSSEVRRLVTLAERDPEAAFAQLLADTEVQSALASARRHCLITVGNVASDAEHSVVSLGKTLWTQARAKLEDTFELLVLRESPVAVYRSGDTPPAQGVSDVMVFTFRDVQDKLISQHCMLWRVEDDDVKLVYPRLPGDPTLGQKLAGRQVVLRDVSMGQPVQLVLVRTPEEPPGSPSADPRGSEPVLKAWLVREVLENRIPGCSVCAVEVR